MSDLLPIVAVTVLEDRASITRRGTLSLAAGQQRIVIDRVAAVLVDKTLTATCSGARVLDVRCERYLAPDVAGSGTAGDLASLRAEQAKLVAARDAALATCDTARAETEALGEVAAASLRDLSLAATRGTSGEHAGQQLAGLDAAEASARVRRIDAELAAEDLSLSLGRLEHRIAGAQTGEGEHAARIVIDLIAMSPVEVTVTAGYVVPGAAWRPSHRALLRADDPVNPPKSEHAGRVEWQTTACVWQATGEDWIDAALTFSLERPSLGVEPPELGDDELRARRRPETVVVETRDHEQQTTGLGGAGPLQVPGIDDGGLGLKLAGTARVTVRSDGAPHRIPVVSFTAPAQLSLIAIPLLSPWVHVRAKLVNTGPTPLLAGPIDLIMASGYVGRAEVGFVAPGEQLVVGFGPESDVRVHRSETRQRDDAGVLGGWHVQTVRVAVRVSNLGARQREIVVTERVPISEVEQVEVQTSAADAYLLGSDDQPGGERITQITTRTIDDRGLVSWTVDLPPLGRRAVTLEYKVKSQRGIAGV